MEELAAHAVEILILLVAGGGTYGVTRINTRNGRIEQALRELRRDLPCVAHGEDLAAIKAVMELDT